MATLCPAPSVTTEVTADDLYRFSWHHLCHEPSQRWRLGISYVVVVGCLVRALLYELPITLLIPSTAAIMVAAPFLLRWRVRWHASQAVRAAPESYGTGTLQLLPEGVHEQSDLGTAMFAWTAIKRIVVTSQGIYFYYSRHAALIVPRRCFASPAAAEAFIAAAREFHTAASGITSRTK